MSTLPQTPFVETGNIRTSGVLVVSSKNDFLQIYSKINIRIVLVAMEFWNNGDKIVRSEIAGEYYDRFAKYRKNTLMKTFPDHDNAQLMW